MFADVVKKRKTCKTRIISLFPHSVGFPSSVPWIILRYNERFKSASFLDELLSTKMSFAAFLYLIVGATFEKKLQKTIFFH
jgi:hypothetical protein